MPRILPRAASAAWMAGVLILASTLLAHKPITTRYSFARDVAPILERHCAGCHRPGGPAPMPLRTFEEARPWAEAIKEEAIEAAMPPWFAEPGLEPLAGESALTAREMDVLADWASGGAPPGESRAAPSAPVVATPVSAGLEERAYPLSASPDRAELAMDLALAEERFLAAWRIEGTGLRGATLRVNGEPAGSWAAGADVLAWPEGAGQRIRAGSRATVSLVRWTARAQKAEGAAGLILRLWLLKAAPPLVVSPSWGEGARLAGFSPAAGGGELSLAAGAPKRTVARLRPSPGAWPRTFFFRDPVRARESDLAWAPSGEGREAGAGRLTLYWLLPR